MLLPSFLCTLIFTLQCVSAVVVFRNGGKLQAVSTIRDGTQPDPKFPKDPTKKGPASDFDKPDAQGNTPVNGNKGLSVGTDVVSKDNAKKAAPIIEKLRSLPNGAERKKALTDLTTLFNGFIPIFNSQKVWRADIAEDDPDLAVVDDGVPLAKKKDPSHRLLTLRRPIPQKSLASTINNRFGTQRVPEETVFDMILTLAGRPAAGTPVPASAPAGPGASVPPSGKDTTKAPPSSSVPPSGNTVPPKDPVNPAPAPVANSPPPKNPTPPNNGGTGPSVQNSAPSKVPPTSSNSVPPNVANPIPPKAPNTAAPISPSVSQSGGKPVNNSTLKPTKPKGGKISKVRRSSGESLRMRRMRRTLI